MKGGYNLKNITAASLERYLLINGWIRNYDFLNRNLMVFELNEEILAFPASEKFTDFYAVLPNILESLSYLYDKSESDISKEIAASYRDLLEFRIKADFSNEGQLPLDYASECIDGIKELILYAACAEQFKQPVCFRITNNAKNLLNSFRLSQTEVGSFVINIDIQVADEEEQYTLNGIEVDSGIEHMVVERIGQAIKQIDVITKDYKLFSEIIDDAYATGVTANMCDALMKLKPDALDAEIETKIRYATACGKKETDVIKIKNHHFYIMNEISRYYKSQDSQVTTSVEGYITSLNKKRIDIVHADRVIRAVVDLNGVMRSVIAELCEADYRIACDAHRDGEKIFISGILDTSKRIYRFLRVESFGIIKE